MPHDLTALAARHAGRPLLMTPRAALELANRVRSVDPRAAVQPGRFSALLRRLSGQDRRPSAMEDDDDFEPVPIQTRLAYAPLYAGEPDDVGFCWSLKDGIALMNVDKPLLDRGEIFCGEVYHGYDTILQGLREATQDDRVRGIFIREATPGGVVASGLPALAAFMRENSARAGGKPIHVYADMACSAGYWMASAADRIVAGRVGLVGSIGAVIVHENWSGALKEAGIEITPIQFGEAKTDGAWWDALSERARADLQAEIDQCGRDFVADVVAGRPQLTTEAVLATQAAVYMGHHDEPARSALALNLIDELASEEAAFHALRDQVAGGITPSAPRSGTLNADAPGGRASASAAKEGRMATKPQAGGKPSNKAALTAARTALARAKADVARLSAEEQAPPEEDDDVDATGDEDMPEAGTDEETDPAAEGEDDAEPEARRISGSPEAAAHPGLALAAISSGQSFAQFQANVKAAGAAPRGQLEATLGGSPRLGADAASKAATAAKLDPKAIYGARKARARRG